MEGTVALDTLKSFKTIMSEVDFKEFIKSEDSAKLRAFPEVAEFVKGEVGEEESEEEKIAREKKEKEKKGEPEPDADDEKAITSELLKGIENRINSKIDAVTSLLKGLLPSTDEIGEIKKSIDSANETLEKIATMPLGTKAARSNPTFFEKALTGEHIEDEAGKTILSITANKEKVLEVMEKGMSGTEDRELIKSYEDSIIRYNGGGGNISQEVAVDLFEKHNTRLVK